MIPGGRHPQVGPDGPLVGRSGLISLWEIMQSFSPRLLIAFASMSSLVAARVDIPIAGLSLRDEELKESQTEGITSFFSELALFCEQFDFKCSLATCERILDLIRAPGPPTFGDLEGLQSELMGRLKDEAEHTVFLILEPREADHYKNPQKGWERVVARFPGSLDHVEECRKCFALSRYAAAVFHSLQVVEVGVIELGKFIGDTDRFPGWTSVTQQLAKVMKMPYEERPPFVRDHGAFIEQVKMTIEALKSAWRNKISHVHGVATVMTAEFPRDIAEEIIFASRGFMGRLASGLPVDSE